MQFLCVDIGESGFSDRDGFGFVVAMDTLYCVVEDAKFRTAINNIACALKPGGYLFLTDSLSPTDDIVDSPQCIRWRSSAEYENVLKNRELTPVVARDFQRGEAVMEMKKDLTTAIS